MRFNLVVLVIVCTVLIQIDSISAQSRPVAPDEYIQSASPLRTGGVITSNMVAGPSHQKLVTIIQPPGKQSVPDIIPTQASQFRVASAASANVAQQQMPVQVQPQKQVYSRPLIPMPKFLSFRQTAYQQPPPSGYVAAGSPQNCNCPPSAAVPTQAPPQPTYQPTPNYYQQQVVQVPPQPVPPGKLFVPGTSLNGQPIVPPSQMSGNPKFSKTVWASGL